MIDDGLIPQAAVGVTVEEKIISVSFLYDLRDNPNAVEIIADMIHEMMDFAASKDIPLLFDNMEDVNVVRP